MIGSGNLRHPPPNQMRYRYLSQLSVSNFPALSRWLQSLNSREISDGVSNVIRSFIDLLSFALWLIWKIRATLSANQMRSKSITTRPVAISRSLPVTVCELSLVLCHIFHCFDWPLKLLRLYDAQSKSALFFLVLMGCSVKLYDTVAETLFFTHWPLVL